MTTTTNRTEHLLALMRQGDYAFNARDFETLNRVHHRDMVAHITGLPEPVYGRDAHSAAMGHMRGLSRHARALRSLPDSVREW